MNFSDKENDISISFRVFIELFVSLLTGGVPILIVYFFYDESMLIDIISNTLPKNSVLIGWSFFLLLLFYLVGCVYYLTFRSNDGPIRIFRFIIIIFNESASTVLNLLRVSSGFCIAVSFLIIYENIYDIRFLTFLSLGGVALFEACVFSSVYYRFVKKIRVNY